MPLYEYKCDNCGELFEKMQKFADEPLTVHEKCGGGPVHRLISVPAFNFKGTGWYVTDYAKGNSNAPNGGSKKDAAEGSKDGAKEGSKEASKEGSKSSEGSKDAAASSKSDSGSSNKSSDSSASPSASNSSSDKK